MSYPLHSLKLGFVGCGSIAQNIIKGYLNQESLPHRNIFISGQNFKKTQRISKELKVSMSLDKEELLEKSSVLFICVKPQSAEKAIQELKRHLQPQHTILSLVAGLNFKTLNRWGLKTKRIIRLMPNTAVCIGEGFLPFCSLQNQKSLNSFTEELLKPLGQTLLVEDENLLRASTVGSAGGLGFVFELMQYWLEWLTGEGFSQEQAQKLVVQTFLGAARLCSKQNNKKFSDLQKEVASSKGVTEEGLREMRELELERVLRLSFEKARLKVKELERLLKEQ